LFHETAEEKQNERHGQPQVMGGRDSLQTWEVAASILNKQLWTDNNKYSSSLGLSGRLTVPYHENYHVSNGTGGLEFEQIL